MTINTANQIKRTTVDLNIQASTVKTIQASTVKTTEMTQ